MLYKKDVKINFLDSLLTKQNHELKNKGRRISSLEKEIRAMSMSVIWRILINFQRMIDKLFPRHMKVRKFYDSFILANQALVNDRFNNLSKYVSRGKVLKQDGNKSNIKEVEAIPISINNDQITVSTFKVANSTNETIAKFYGSFPKYKHPLVSIIILTFNNIRYTHQCLDSVLKNTDIPYELIVVDNDSQDGTKGFLKRLKNVTVIFNEKNIGFGQGCNQGAEEAKGKYILFLNNDTIVTRGWLKNMVATIENIKDCGAVGAKILFFNGLLQEAGTTIYRDGNCYPHGLEAYPYKNEYSYLREVDHCAAVCLLVNKKLFLQIGGFDKKYYPAYYEDVDLSMEIRERGYRIYYQPNTIIYHYKSLSLTGERVEHLIRRNTALFKKKWKNQLKLKIARDTLQFRETEIL